MEQLVALKSVSCDKQYYRTIDYLQGRRGGPVDAITLILDTLDKKLKEIVTDSLEKRINQLENAINNVPQELKDTEIEYKSPR